MAFFSCGPLGLCLPLLLVILLSFPTRHVFAKEDRLPTCEELNEDYDDDTVICNQQDASDYSYDLSKLDPNRAPLRCRDWDRSMVDLDVLDEYYICEKWHKLYGVLRPVMTQAPTVSPTRTPTTSPTGSPTTNAPTRAAVIATSPPTVDTNNDNNQEDSSSSPKMQSIPLDDFSLRIVIPTKIQRMLRSLQQQVNAVPYNQEEFTIITSHHLYQHLEKELNRNVAAVHLDITQSRATSLQGSTIVKETLSGSVDFEDTGNAVPSPRTVNALAIQALEGQALWEYIFRLRGAQDAYLAKTQQVTLVDSSSSFSTESSSDSPISTGVIVTLVIIGLVTASIVGYFVYWLKKQQAMDHQNASNGDQSSKKWTGTPDTQGSGNSFFADTPPETKHNKSFRKSAKKQQQEEMSVSNLSFVSSVNSALHSIRERSWEDEEEEPEEDEESWTGNDTTGSEIDVVQDGLMVENMPPLNYSNGDEVTIVTEQEYGAIHRIMPLETSYCTSNGTEVTRRDVDNGTSTKPPKPTTEKPANRWLMWKKSTGRQQKKNAAAKAHRQAMLAQQRKQQQQQRPPMPPPFDTSLDPPSMVDMSLEPPSQVMEVSGLETSLDPPSQTDIEGPSFTQSDTSLEGESIQF